MRADLNPTQRTGNVAASSDLTASPPRPSPQFLPSFDVRTSGPIKQADARAEGAGDQLSSIVESAPSAVSVDDAIETMRNVITMTPPPGAGPKDQIELNTERHGHWITVRGASKRWSANLAFIDGAAAIAWRSLAHERWNNPLVFWRQPNKTDLVLTSAIEFNPPRSFPTVFGRRGSLTIEGTGDGKLELANEQRELKRVTIHVADEAGFDLRARIRGTTIPQIVLEAIASGVERAEGKVKLELTADGHDLKRIVQGAATIEAGASHEEIWGALLQNTALRPREGVADLGNNVVLPAPAHATPNDMILFRSRREENVGSTTVRALLTLDDQRNATLSASAASALRALEPLAWSSSARWYSPDEKNVLRAQTEVSFDSSTLTPLWPGSFAEVANGRASLSSTGRLAVAGRDVRLVWITLLDGDFELLSFRSGQQIPVEMLRAVEAALGHAERPLTISVLCEDDKHEINARARVNIEPGTSHERIWEKIFAGLETSTEKK